MRRRGVLRRLRGAERGVVAVEFAIVFPIFFLLLYGIFDFARACWIANSLQYAVAQGARYVMLGTGGSDRPNGVTCSSWDGSALQTNYEANVKAYMQKVLDKWHVGAASPSVTASCAAGSPSIMTATVSASYTFVFEFGGLNNLFPGGFPMRQRGKVSVPLG